MAINFPDNPFNGQTTTFSGVTYSYNSTKNQWTANNPSTANISSSDNAPTSPSAGDLWFNSANGVMYIYYNDGSSSQWISISGYASSFDSASTISLIDSDYVQARQTTAASTTIVTDINGLIAISSPTNGDQAYVQSNNNLYFYDSGWYKIATVSNDSPTAITGVSGSYALDISGGTTTITAVSTDPEGFPLTWSYSTSGLGSIATISQASNVFTITPSTNTANAGSFTLTINVTDGINGALSTSSTLTLQFAVTNSKYTTALITAVDTSDNNNITDASSNNHSITVAGDVIAGTFSPYRHGGYSTYFNNNGNYLTISDDVSLRLDSTDWTIEAWVWWEGDTSDYKILLSKDKKYQLYTQPSTGYISFYNSSAELQSTAAPTINGWTHIAATYDYSSTTLKLYKDGINIGTNTSYSIPTSTGDNLTIAQEDSPPNGWDGYIRDLRIVKGTVVYTSNFTPPTEKLEAISGTSLLACSLSYLKDQSTNNHSFTTTGSVTIEPFSPYDYQEYSASDHGGSVYLDGSGDYLQPTTSAIGAFGNNDFTIEFWIWPNSIGQDQVLLDCRPLGSNGNYMDIFLAPSGQIGTYINLATRLSGGPIIVNTWTHIAVVGTSSGTTLYINGSQVDTDNYTASYLSSASRPRIGASGYHSGTQYAFSGYLSDIKIVEGTALYTSDFTRPASPLSSSGASLHIKGTDASIIDKTQTGNVLLSGVTGSTTQAKFASTKSIDVTSAANYAVAQNIDGNFGSGSFTIECWIWPETLDITYAQNALGTVLDLDVSLGSGTDWWVIHQTNNGGLEFASNSGNVLTSTNSVLTAQTWHHIAIVRSGSTLTWYVDGTARGTTSNSNSIGSVRDLHIGKQSGVNRYFKGYIQDIRITKGLARYTSNFTPPTSELQG
jgi:hypothetical protein